VGRGDLCHWKGISKYPRGACKIAR
jgi:hypothetical protein